MCTEKVCSAVTNSRAVGYKTNQYDQYEKNFISDQKTTSKNLPKNQNSIDLVDIPQNTLHMVEKLQELGFNESEIELILWYPDEFKSVPKALAELARIGCRLHGELLNYTATITGSLANLHFPELVSLLREINLSDETIAKLLSADVYVQHMHQLLTEYLDARKMIIKAIKSAIYRMREKIKKNPKKYKKKRNMKPREEPNETVRRFKILTSLFGEEEGICVAEIAKRADMNRRWIPDTLKILMECGYVTMKKVGKTHYYTMTHGGVKYLLNSLWTKWRWSLPNTKGNKDRQNVHSTRESILGFLSLIQIITKELLAMGWYHRNIKKLFKREKAKDVMELIKYARKINLDNPGAYLFKVLMKWGSKQEFFANLTNKTIKELQKEDNDGDLADAFLVAGRSLTEEQFVHFANSTRKFYRTCQWVRKQRAKEGNTTPWTFTRIDVFGIADWVRKRSEGVTIR